MRKIVVLLFFSSARTKIRKTDEMQGIINEICILMEIANGLCTTYAKYVDIHRFDMLSGGKYCELCELVQALEKKEHSDFAHARPQPRRGQGQQSTHPCGARRSPSSSSTRPGPAGQSPSCTITDKITYE